MSKNRLNGHGNETIKIGQSITMFIVIIKRTKIKKNNR